MKIFITIKANNALGQIRRYFKAQGYAKHGIKITTSILRKALVLKTFPLSGQIEANLEVLGKSHRYLVDGHYKIIYRIEGDIVYVTDVFDTRQDPNGML